MTVAEFLNAIKKAVNDLELDDSLEMQVFEIESENSYKIYGVEFNSLTQTLAIVAGY